MDIENQDMIDFTGGRPPVTPEASPEEHALAVITDTIAGHIRRCWDTAQRAKEGIQEELVENQRQRKGEYSDDKLKLIQEQGGSTIFRRLTATKCVAAESWIMDVITPQGERSWFLQPTPIPALSPELQQQIAQQVVSEAEQLYMQGIEVPAEAVIDYAEQLRDEIIDQEMIAAKKAAEKMEKLIADQLYEGGYYQAFRGFVSDVVTYRSGVLKGPVFRKTKRLTWANGSPVVNEEIIPIFERVSPFDIYFAPDAACPQEGYIIEKQRLSRREIYNMIGLPGYKEDEIRAVLNESQTNSLKEWTQLDWERQKLEDRDPLYDEDKDSSFLDALEFHGSIKGSLLTEWGLIVDDQDAEYEVWAIMIGTHVVKVEFNADMLGRRPYYVTSFEKVPGSIWGKGVPDKMVDGQMLCNATIRSLANNLAIASGPQAQVNVDLLPAGEKLSSIRPFKIWQYHDIAGNKNRPVEFFQPNSNAAELLNVYAAIKEEIDEDTGIPKYVYGDQRVGGAGQTASGLSMLMNAASKGIKNVIRNIDEDVQSKLLRRLYEHNMIYSDDEEVKGDLQIEARGALAMIVKEQIQAARGEFLKQTLNDVDMQIIGIEGRANVLREYVKSLDMPVDKIIPSDKDIAARQQQQQMMQQQMMLNAPGVQPEAARGGSGA